jgi:hypothetical protein
MNEYLHENNLTMGTREGFAALHKRLDHFVGPFGVLVRFGVLLDAVLILFAIHSLVNRLKI